MPQQANIADKQLIEVPIAASGPVDPNRMFICTGILQCNFSAYDNSGSGVTVKETFLAQIEPNPQLTEGQFKRAIATASVTDVYLRDSQPAQWDSFRWGIEEVQADLDDETSQVELRVALMAVIQGQQTQLNINKVGFQVTILARI